MWQLIAKEKGTPLLEIRKAKILSVDCDAQEISVIVRFFGQ